VRILVTGAGGLVGSAVSEISARLGHTVIAVENNFRGRILGGDVRPTVQRLRSLDISVIERDISMCAQELIDEVDAVVHCAGQPSHDFSVKSPNIDYRANVETTMAILTAHHYSTSKPKIVFLSTNKVYGDLINQFLFFQEGDRFVFPDNDCLSISNLGVDESFPIEPCARTPFGASKLAADFMVQEWAHTYSAQTCVFRCSCITGSTGTPLEMHGFLGYLVKRAVSEQPYTVYGHRGFQVRDNIAAVDLTAAILLWLQSPKSGVYNMGGGYDNSLSIREAVNYLEGQLGLCCFVDWGGPARFADHKWWITNTARFERDFPSWKRQIGVKEVLNEMVECERSGRVSSSGYEAVPSSVVEAIGLQLQQGRALVEQPCSYDAAGRGVSRSRNDGWAHS
jgi:CDP-paratose 2-epimerase